MLRICTAACGEKEQLEGTNLGECTDGSDNDIDGTYDYDDADCFTSPDCAEGDTGTEVDNDSDGVTQSDGDCDDNDADINPTGHDFYRSEQSIAL